MTRPGFRTLRNHGVLRAKSRNFQGLAFIPKMEKILLWDLKWKGKTQINVKVTSEWEIKVYESLNLSGEKFFFPSTTTKTR